ncbi:MAG: apolipoprotein N-acyltransferase [Pirellulales bacterium]
MSVVEQPQNIDAVDQPQPAAQSRWPRRKWYLSTLALGVAGSVLLWAALPKLSWWPLAWIAPVPWLLLIRRETLCGIQPDVLPNRVHFVGHPYALIFKSGLLFWLAALWWLTLPHWTGYFGWMLLSLYLAFYVTAFIWLSRVAVHRLRVPLLVAAPVVWIGLEYTRAHLLSGFLLAGLGHTQYQWIELIQISDIAGAYGVSFLVMFVSACLARCLPDDGQPWSWRPLPLAAAALALALGYGYWRTSDVPTTPGPKIALIQGNIDTVFGGDYLATRKRTYDDYLRLSRQAVAEHDDLDLIIWPESMYRGPWITVSEDAWMEAPSDAPDLTREQSRQWLEAYAKEAAAAIADTARTLDAPLLLGVDTQAFGPGTREVYSTALHVDADGRVLGHYHKMHPVIFGEYMPLGDVFPQLYELLPISSGLAKGAGPVVIEVDGARVAPNICYETVLPHLIRRQIHQLTEQQQKPQVLTTQTNDGWFYGSAALDFHLICNVFRAVEMHTPLVTAANTGISAHIDGSGRIVEAGPTRAERVIVAQVQLDPRGSFYLQTGDWLAGGSALFCGLLAGVGLWRRKTAPRRCEAV